MTDFTPGPWRVVAEGRVGFCVVTAWNSSPFGWEFITTIMPHHANNHDLTEANAALIAAAPDMYAALLAFLSEWRMTDGHDESCPSLTRAPGGDCGYSRCKVYEQACIALAKANGGTA